jgi:hypothetical protein
MLHTRSHRIEDIAVAEALAYKLRTVNAADAGFRFGGYLWLNDSTLPSGLQEYAVVRERDGLQVESVTVAWVFPEVLTLMITAAAAGDYDESPMAKRGVMVVLDTAQHRLSKLLALEPQTVKYIDWGQDLELELVTIPDVLRSRVDLRSLRQIRTDHACAEIVSAACRRLWSGDVELWAKAVEWYENRPSGGDTRGEALFSCLGTFDETAKAIGWRGVSASEREAFERAAGKLSRHVVR